MYECVMASHPFLYQAIEDMSNLCEGGGKEGHRCHIQ